MTIGSLTGCNIPIVGQILVTANATRRAPLARWFEVFCVSARCAFKKKRRLLTVNVLPCAECGLEPFGSNVYSTKSDIYFSTQQRHKMIKNWRSNWSHAHAYAKYVWWYVESPFCCEQIHLFQLLKRDESCLVSRLGVYWIWTSDSLLSSSPKRLNHVKRGVQFDLMRLLLSLLSADFTWRLFEIKLNEMKWIMAVVWTRYGKSQGQCRTCLFEFNHQIHFDLLVHVDKKTHSR
jgi:hypothetical protein